MPKPKPKPKELPPELTANQVAARRAVEKAVAHMLRIAFTDSKGRSRKGHGGCPITRRVLRPSELEFMFRVVGNMVINELERAGTTA